MDCKKRVKGRKRFGKGAKNEEEVKGEGRFGKEEFCEIYVKRRQNSGKAATCPRGRKRRRAASGGKVENRQTAAHANGESKQNGGKRQKRMKVWR